MTEVEIVMAEPALEMQTPPSGYALIRPVKCIVMGRWHWKWEWVGNWNLPAYLPRLYVDMAGGLHKFPWRLRQIGEDSRYESVIVLDKDFHGGN